MSVHDKVFSVHSALELDGGDSSAADGVIIGVASAGGTAVVLLLIILVCIAICYYTWNKPKKTNKIHVLTAKDLTISDC